MHMKDIRWPKPLRRLDHCATKHREALGVVCIVAVTVTVESFAIAKFRMVDEVELHSVVLSTIYDLAKEEVVLHWNCKVRDRQMRFCEMGSPVAWQKDCELMAQSSQSLRKSADNIGKTAGLRVRHSLRRGDSDSQPKFLLLGFSTDLPA